MDERSRLEICTAVNTDIAKHISTEFSLPRDLFQRHQQPRRNDDFQVGGTRFRSHILGIGQSPSPDNLSVSLRAEPARELRVRITTFEVKHWLECSGYWNTWAMYQLKVNEQQTIVALHRQGWFKRRIR